MQYSVLLQGNQITIHLQRLSDCSVLGLLKCHVQPITFPKGIIKNPNSIQLSSLGFHMTFHSMKRGTKNLLTNLTKCSLITKFLLLPRYST